jgi:hypothetical protein
MKRLYGLVFVALLANSCRASKIASSFEQAAALGDAQEKEPAALAYRQRELTPYYQEKYGPIFESCLASTEDTSPFSFVAAIGKDGRLLRLYVDHETNIFACVKQALQQGEFPRPPLFPYYMHVSMSFSK